MFNQRRSYHQQNSSYTGVGAFSSAPAPSNSALAAASVIGQALKANNNNPTGLNIPPIQQRRNSMVSQSRSGSLQSHQSRNFHGSISGRSSSRTNSFVNSNNDNSNQIRRNSVTSARPASVIGTSRLNVKRSTPNLGRRSVSDFHNYTPNTPSNNVNSLPKTVKKWIPSANGLVCVEIPNPKHPDNQSQNHSQNPSVKRSVSLSSSNHHAYPTRSGSIVRNNSGFLTRRRSVTKSITKSTKVLNNGTTVETTTVEQIVDGGNDVEHEDQHYDNFDSDQPQINSLDMAPSLNEIEEDDNEDDVEVKRLDSSKFNNKKLSPTHSKFKKISPSKSKFEVDYDDDDDYVDNDNVKMVKDDEIVEELGEERIKEEKVKNMIAKNEEIEKIQRERAFSSIDGPIEDTVKVEDDLSKPIIEDAAIINDETEDEEYTEEEKRLAELRLEELVRAKEQEIMDGLIKNGQLQNKDDDSMNTVVSEYEDGGEEEEENNSAKSQLQKQNVVKKKQADVSMEEEQYLNEADGEISNIDDSLTQNEIIPILEQNTSRTEPLNLNEKSDSDFENDDSSIVSSDNNEYMDTQADESSGSIIIKNPLLSNVGSDKEDHSPKKSMADRLRPGLTISPVSPGFENLEIPKRSPEIQAQVDDLQNRKPLAQRNSMIISSEQSKRKSVLKNSKEPARYSMYNSPSASGAYLSLATAENTRLNAMASSSTGSFQQQTYVSPPSNQRNSMVGRRQSLNNLQDAPPPLAAATRAAQKHSNQANQANQLSSSSLRNSASTPNIRKSQLPPAKPKQQQQKRMPVERPAQKRAKELYELSKTRPVIQSSDLLKLDSEDQRRSSFEKISETNSTSPQKKEQQRLTLRDGIDPEEIMLQQNVDLSNNKRFASVRGYKSRFGDTDSDLEIPVVNSIKNNVSSTSAEPPSSSGMNIFKSKFRSEKRNSSIPNNHATSAASTPVNMNFPPQNTEYANGNGNGNVNMKSDSNDAHHPNVSEFSSKFQNKFFSEPHNHRNVSGVSHASTVSTVTGGEKKPRFGKLKKLFGSKKS